MSQQKTIIHTEASGGWGGQELRTLTECQWFAEQGWNVILLAHDDAKISKRFKEAGLTTIHVPFSKKTQIQDYKTCLEIFKKEQPHLVASHSNIDTRVALFAATRAKVTHRIRYRHVSIPVRPNLWNKYIYRKLATAIVTTGDCISNPLIKNLGLDPAKVHTVHTGIKPPVPIPDRETSRLKLCKDLKLPETTRFIGQVSVLRRWKGQADVMKGFDSIADKHPNYHLVFVGGGHGEEYLPPIAAKKKHSDRIHFVGHQTDPWPYFCAMDINLLASTEGEGIPQVGMQSMLCQTAFIGTKIGGIPEIIQHGETGLLVDANAPDQIADTLDTLLNDPETLQTLTKNAHNWAVQNTTVAGMGNKILNLIS